MAVGADPAAAPAGFTGDRLDAVVDRVLAPRRLAARNCWDGPVDLTTEQVDDPGIEEPTDAVLKVRLSATCGSDHHYIHGILPTMERGDIFGHEFMGEVVATGSSVAGV